MNLSKTDTYYIVSINYKNDRTWWVHIGTTSPYVVSFEDKKELASQFDNSVTAKNAAEVAILMRQINATPFAGERPQPGWLAKVHKIEATLSETVIETHGE